MATVDTAPTDAEVDRVRRIVDETVKAFNQAAPFQPPPLPPRAAIECSSTPIYVAIHGKEHRLTALINSPKIKATASVKLTDENCMEVNVDISKITQSHMMGRLCAGLIERETIKPGTQMFWFPPAWGIDHDPEENKIDVECCVLHFSKAEIDALLELEVPNTHLVLCVVTSDRCDDMTECDDALATMMSESGKPSVMQLKWWELKTTDRVIVDRPWQSRVEKRKRPDGEDGVKQE